jgi:hypothetical protein
MRFFLHIEDGITRIVDQEGSELPTLADAHQEALACARQLWASAIVECRDLSAQSFVVADEGGQILATLSFLEALPVGLRQRLRSD